MPYHTLKLDCAGEVATLTLYRPEKRNSLTTEMIEELGSALGETETSAARVLIMTGAGESFCSGMDIGELKALTAQSFQESVEDSRRMGKLFRLLYSFPKPLIAAVNGAAVAGGASFATEIVEGAPAFSPTIAASRLGRKSEALPVRPFPAFASTFHSRNRFSASCRRRWLFRRRELYF